MQVAKRFAKGYAGQKLAIRSTPVILAGCHRRQHKSKVGIQEFLSAIRVRQEAWLGEFALPARMCGKPPGMLIVLRAVY
jgi:hypothetical protein